MNKPGFYIGVDIGSEQIAVSVGTRRLKIVQNSDLFENNADGFDKILSWIQKQGVTSHNSVVCMEATGVYEQALAYFLVTHKYRVSVEPPLKVKRALSLFMDIKTI